MLCRAHCLMQFPYEKGQMDRLDLFTEVRTVFGDRSASVIHCKIQE